MLNASNVSCRSLESEVSRNDDNEFNSRGEGIGREKRLNQNPVDYSLSLIVRSLD